MLKIASFAISKERKEYNEDENCYDYVYRDETIHVDKETALNVIGALGNLFSIIDKLSTSYKGVVNDRRKPHKTVVGDVKATLNYAREFDVEIKTDTEHCSFTITIDEGIALVNYLESVIALYP